MLFASLTRVFALVLVAKGSKWRTDEDGEAFEPLSDHQLTEGERKPGLFQGDIKLGKVTVSLVPIDGAKETRRAIENERPPTDVDLNEFNARRGQQWRWPSAQIPFVINASSQYCESVASKSICG